jgi:hypothetical protein
MEVSMKKAVHIIFYTLFCIPQILFSQVNKGTVEITLQTDEVLSNSVQLTQNAYISYNAGEYNIKIPYKIVHNAEFFPEKNSNAFPRLPHAVITLADGMVLKGKAHGSILVENSLGKAEMELGWEIKKLEFIREGLKKYREKPIGKHKLTVIKNDQSKVLLENAGFVQEVYGKTGEFIKDEYSDTFTFEKDKKLYPISWDKIKYFITADKTESHIGTPQYSPLILVTKDEKRFYGRASIWKGCAHAIEGLIVLNANYTLYGYLMINHDNISNCGNQAFVRLEF